MGYLTEQNQQQAIALVNQRVRELKVLRPNGLDLSYEGETELAKRSMAHIAAFGALDIIRFAEIVDEIRAQNVTNRGDMPHSNDPQLAWLTSVDAYNEASSDKIRRYMQPVAIDSGLHQRFNERVTWLRDNKVRRPKTEQTAAAPAVPLTPQQKQRQEITQRLENIYKKIDGAGGHDWQQRTIQFRLWLKNKVKELISEKRGIGFIEKHIDDAIRDQENGSIR